MDEAHLMLAADNANGFKYIILGSINFCNTVMPTEEETANYLVGHNLLEAPNDADHCHKCYAVMKWSRKPDDRRYFGAAFRFPKGFPTTRSTCGKRSHFSITRIGAATIISIPSTATESWQLQPPKHRQSFSWPMFWYAFTFYVKKLLYCMGRLLFRFATCLGMNVALI